MRKIARKPALLPAFAALCATLAIPSATFAQEEEREYPPGPYEIVNNAPQSDWQVIEAEDLLVMTLAPDRDGNEREVVMQLMPAPFSQDWVENIRILARSGWYDGISINRVQDNYVVQWGDPGHDNPESGEVETKPLPEELNETSAEGFATSVEWAMADDPIKHIYYQHPKISLIAGHGNQPEAVSVDSHQTRFDGYPATTGFFKGWPISGTFRSYMYRGKQVAYPVHCYGMIGVGRSYAPDAGSGAELYTVIGHAPRHLDRNIALVGRVISGMEHLSTLPRGSGALGFYTQEEADKRTPILSIRVASDLPEEERPQFEFLSTESETFARYAHARANREDAFFTHSAGGADICNIPVPIRAIEAGD